MLPPLASPPPLSLRPKKPLPSARKLRKRRHKASRVNLWSKSMFSVKNIGILAPAPQADEPAAEVQVVEQTEAAAPQPTEEARKHLLYFFKNSIANKFSRSGRECRECPIQ